MHPNGFYGLYQLRLYVEEIFLSLSRSPGVSVLPLLSV